MDRKIQCVLVHNHLLLRQGLRRLLEDEPDLQIVAEADNASDAMQKVVEHRPDVVITDAGTFGCDPYNAERLILGESPASKVLFLNVSEINATGWTPSHDPRGTARETSVEELVKMVREVHSDGRAVREPRDNNAWTTDELSTRRRSLTAREREVLKLLAEGKTVRSAAGLMGLSVKTVDAHKFNLMRKLGLHNKAELVMWAIQKKVVRVPAEIPKDVAS